MSAINWLHHLPGNGVYSLRDAQNSLLQVLLTEFRLAQDDHGFTLEVSFKESDPAIRRREAKAEIQNYMPGHPSKVGDLQGRINAVFSGKTRFYHHMDLDFAFRYASGGTLPIIEINSDLYYCLFYRDVFPVGWNIANGSCDSLPELLDPKRAIGRELQEELIILALAQRLDYQLDWKSKPKTSIIVPDLLDARRLSDRFLPQGLHIDRFRKQPLRVEWNPQGPDTLHIQYEPQDRIVPPTTEQGYYLNITTKDFGIELDCIARIPLPPGAVLLDGEINDNRLLNRPIGLFRVDKMQKAIDHSTEFLPDILFHSAVRVLDIPSSPDEFYNSIIDGKFLTYLQEIGLRNEEEIYNRRKVPLDERFDLCPVTRSIIQRHRRGSAISSVFLCYSSVDRSKAEQVERDLASKNINVWLDVRSLGPDSPIDESIKHAIKESSYILFLASEHSLNSSFVKNEIQYASDINKLGIVMILEDLGQDGLPLGTIRWMKIDSRDRYQEALRELVVAFSEKVKALPR